MINLPGTTNISFAIRCFATPSSCFLRHFATDINEMQFKLLFFSPPNNQLALSMGDGVWVVPMTWSKLTHASSPTHSGWSPTKNVRSLSMLRMPRRVYLVFNITLPCKRVFPPRLNHFPLFIISFYIIDPPLSPSDSASAFSLCNLCNHQFFSAFEFRLSNFRHHW